VIYYNIPVSLKLKKMCKRNNITLSQIKNVFFISVNCDINFSKGNTDKDCEEIYSEKFKSITYLKIYFQGQEHLSTNISLQMVRMSSFRKNYSITLIMFNGSSLNILFCTLIVY